MFIYPYSYLKLSTKLLYIFRTGVFFLFIIACSEDNTPQTSQLEIPAFVVSNQNVTIQESYVADIQAIKNVEIRSKVSGYIEKIFIDEGKRVSKGQILFKISDTEYKTELDAAVASFKTAMAEAKIAELEVERIKKLVEQQVISPIELEVAKAKFAAAQAKVEEAKAAEQKALLKISYTNIVAPFDGQVDRIPLKIGSLVQDGTLLTTISDYNQIYAYFKISESQYLKLMKSLQNDSTYQLPYVSLILADGSMYEYKGKIETMEGEFETTTGSIAMRAIFPNPKRLLKHGSSGKIIISEEIKNVKLIPHKAVLEIQDKNYVYVVKKDKKLSLRSFVPKRRLKDYYIVDSGIQVGELVVYEGIQNLKEDLRITPKIVKLDSLIS
ncbi:MAG: efflux RND transporter periplasmic adaptor subunit [Bacteroidia bacterium]|nr:efflux RND transporter periplasmic adaptor subunit [Bacteroidia bacterium]MDW8159155.1 efflux RND transporter periplasmic adaptor subunit [Bacteroidia bacterium]